MGKEGLGAGTGEGSRGNSQPEEVSLPQQQDGSQALRKLLVVGLDPRLGGGMQMVALGLDQELRRRGVEVRMVHGRLGHPKDASPELTFNGFAYEIALPGAVLHDPGDPLRDCGDPTGEQAFRLLLKDWRPDLVFFIHTAGLGMSLVHVARQESLPTIIYVGDYYLMCPMIKLFHRSFGQCRDPLGGLACSHCTVGKQHLAPSYSFRIKFARDLLSNKANLITAQSQAARQALLRFGVPAEKVRVVWPGILAAKVLPRRKRPPGAPIAFGFVGNADFPKGCHLLIEAFLKLPVGRASLTFYGGGETNYMKRLEIESRGRVHFAGSYDNERLPEIMQGIDVGVVPSLWQECGPLVVSEFLHHRVAVIGFNTGGIPEQMKADTDGFLVPVGDTQALEAAMRRFLDEPELINVMPADRRQTSGFGHWAEEIISLAGDLISEQRQLNKPVPEGAVPDGVPDGKDLITPTSVESFPAPAKTEDPTGVGGAGISGELGEAEELKKKGDLTAAARRAQAILSSNQATLPQKLHCHMLLAECLAKQGQIDPARRHFAAALEGDPDNPQFLLSAASLELASGQATAAVDLFERALSVDQRNDQALCGLGLSLSQCGRAESGFEQLLAALKINPENTTALCGLAVPAYKNGQLAELETHLRRYLDYHPGNCDFLYSLAGCLFAQGKREEAIAEVANILALKPDHEMATELRQALEEGRVPSTAAVPDDPSLR